MERLSIYDFSQTWVVRNLDDKVIRYVKDWLHFHQGANLGHIKLSISKFDFGFQLPSDVFKFCKLSTEVILKESKNKEVRALFKTTSTSNIAIDSVIVNNEDNPNLALKHQIENNVLEHLAGLTEHSYATYEDGSKFQHGNKFVTAYLPIFLSLLGEHLYSAYLITQIYIDGAK